MTWETVINYYKHHIGDYAKKTGELTLVEHGAYLLMLHTYYGTEKPLPIGDKLYRMLRAFTKAERAAVDCVVAQFWTRTEAGGLVNGRAFAEMESATELIEIARHNGKGGGRPKKPSGIPSRLSENNPAGSEKEPSGKAPHVPGSGFQPEIPTPTPPKGGAGTHRRSPDRANRDAALTAWTTVVKSEGATDDPKAREAMRVIGGYSRIRLRTVHEESQIRREFIDAYRGAGAPP